MGMTKRVPQVDLTTINSVHSIFTLGPKDPWSSALAADFVDLILWNDAINIPVAVLSDSIIDEDMMIPAVLTDLRRRDPGWLSTDLRILPEPRQLLPALLDPALSEFGAFAVNNSLNVRQFLQVHKTPWMDIQAQSRSGPIGHYVFDVAQLARQPATSAIASRLQVPDDNIHYLLDLVLKYLIYAEHANGDYYLTHPIRSKQAFKYLRPIVTSYHVSRPRRIPFRLGPYIVQAAQDRNRDWFTSTLHEARGYLRQEGMTELEDAGSISRDALRELAAHLRLPARLRKYEIAERTATLVSAGGGIAGSVISTHLWPSVVGSSMTIATKIWSGSMPAGASRLRWLRWMLQWPLEEETQNVDRSTP
jgi:hypothetical protein